MQWKHRSCREVCRKRTARRSPQNCRASRSIWPRHATCKSRVG
jgi:hypothetical protein